MAPSTFPTSGALGSASQSPAAVTLLLLILISDSPETEGCLNCGLHFKNLKNRYARLCTQYRERYSQANCTSYPWGRESSLGLALDEMSLDLLLEKTHRVFRVIALCPPACQGSAFVLNCTTCRGVDVPCWDMKTCYPEGGDLEKVAKLICSISGSCLFLGLVSCALEFWLRAKIGEEEGPG